MENLSKICVLFCFICIGICGNLYASELYENGENAKNWRKSKWTRSSKGRHHARERQNSSDEKQVSDEDRSRKITLKKSAKRALRHTCAFSGELERTSRSSSSSKSSPPRRERVERFQPQQEKPSIRLIPERIEFYEEPKPIRYTCGSHEILEDDQLPSIRELSNVRLKVSFSQLDTKSNTCLSKKLSMYVPDDGFSPTFCLFHMVRSTLALHGQGDIEKSDDVWYLFRYFYLGYFKSLEASEVMQKKYVPGMFSAKKAERVFIDEKPITLELLRDVSTALNLSTLSISDTLFMYQSTIYRRPINSFGKFMRDPWERSVGFLRNPFDLGLEKRPLVWHQDVSIEIKTEDQFYLYMLPKLFQTFRDPYEVAGERKVDKVPSLKELTAFAAVKRLLKKPEEGIYISMIKHLYPHELVNIVLSKQLKSTH